MVQIIYGNQVTFKNKIFMVEVMKSAEILLKIPDTQLRVVYCREQTKQALNN